jgi:tetratricopeptide (TPR) repeat protein
MATLYKYEAFIYGYKDAAFRKEVFDSLMKLGLYVEAVDTMVEGHPGNRADAGTCYHAGEASCRVDHPNRWNLDGSVIWSGTRSVHNGSFQGKADLLLARYHSARYFDATKHKKFGDPGGFAASNPLDEIYELVTNHINSYLKSNPDNAEPYVIKAKLETASEKYDEAYLEYKKAEKCKDFTDYQMADMAESAAKCGKTDEARKLALKSLRRCSSASVHNALALAYIKEGKYKPAADELEKSLAIHMWNIEAVGIYAQLLKKLGNGKKSAEYEAFVSELTPSQLYIKSALDRDITQPFNASMRLNE